MSPDTHLPNPLLQVLTQQLEAARLRDQAIASRNQHGTIMQIPGTGKAISSAYEQLRNAAEYTEEHLLLQRAIRRFYNRNLSFFTQREVGIVGEELVVELTQAGYLRNRTISLETAEAIRTVATDYMHAYWQLRDANVSRDEASEWILDILSVETEEMLNPHSYLGALAQFGYQHYLQLFPRDRLIKNEQEQTSYEISLYIAVHMALLKSDLAVVRHDLMRMYQQTPAQLAAFIQFNRTVSELYTSDLMTRLKRVVSKYGAPIRILKSMVEDRPDLATLLANREQFLDAYHQQTIKEYHSVGRRLTKGLLRSIAFIFITKIIIGLGIEIPYDLLFLGHIAFLPLAINLLFPPLYMASLKFSMKVPASANAESLRMYIDKTLYGHELPVAPMIPHAQRRTSVRAKILYSLLFLVPLAIVVYLLYLLHFAAVQGIIFFVFLSTASFLGFRLSRMVRELELMGPQAGFLGAMRDFFYLPFIQVGQWLSSKYAKVNAVAYVLDIAIELPLKTVLRLLRQWTRFLNEKRDEIY